ncbi:MAG TPA: type VI secretion system protein TssL, long form [Acetobacteraceae bacterium]|nr:type VI secretion system protein TssL, long form [Acetobacteraceae bacterium]
MSDNPFAEPADNDRTVIRPIPGRRRAGPPGPSAPSAVPAAEPAPLPAADPSAPPAISVSPLTAAASPLLQLLNRLRALRRPPDVQALRDRTLQDLRTFERQGRDAGIAMELLRPAHYALCASIDDVVLNTPWGAASGWAKQTLVATLHPGARGTDQFFDQLRQMQRAPDKFLPVIELMVLCLSLGFMGRYRQALGEGELDRILAEAHAAITTQRQAPDPELSRRWRGITAPYRPGRRGLPVWVALAGAVAVCGGLLFWASTSLNAASDGLLAKVLATPPTGMPQVTRTAILQPLPPPPAALEPTVLDRLGATLRPDIDSGAVSLLGTPATPIIRITDRAVFASGSAVVQAASLPLLERIAAALRAESGSLRVIDYTDNQPIRTVQFPSNFQLSAARANAVRAIVARDVGDAARVTAEGRADADPIAPNTTAEGREQNRRIEIVLRRDAG